MKKIFMIFSRKNFRNKRHAKEQKENNLRPGAYFGFI